MIRHRFIASILLALPLVFLWGGSSRSDAAMISIFGTGLNNDGSLAASGSTDLHYSITAPPGTSTAAGPFVLTSAATSGYTGNTSSSQFIGPSASGAYGAVGVYTYTTTFSLAGLNPSTALLTGAIAADDFAEIYLNGVDTGKGTASSYTALTPFTINSGFVNGINTLTIMLTNNGGETALQLQVSGTASAVPEPSSLVMCGIALPLGLALMHRRNCS